MSAGIRSKNNNVFVFSSYWRTWSRILQEGTERNDGACIEVDLTPSNSLYARSWERTATINIRQHRTNRDADLFVGLLPEEVVVEMLQWLDEATIERLLHEDFLPKIDWVLYKKHSNGGASFESIKKEI